MKETKLCDPLRSQNNNDNAPNGAPRKEAKNNHDLWPKKRSFVLWASHIASFTPKSQIPSIPRNSIYLQYLRQLPYYANIYICKQNVDSLVAGQQRKRTKYNKLWLDERELDQTQTQQFVWILEVFNACTNKLQLRLLNTHEIRVCIF